MAERMLFDKLTYVDRLTKAGIDEAQARAHAEAMDVADVFCRSKKRWVDTSDR
jgi:hypothetical protein